MNSICLFVVRKDNIYSIFEVFGLVFLEVGIISIVEFIVVDFELYFELSDDFFFFFGLIEGFEHYM